jgi:TonB family protein
MSRRKLSEEERFSLIITSLLNVIIIIITLLVYTDDSMQNRSALIEVTLGEFRDGSMAQFNEQRNLEVATRRNPTQERNPDPQPQQEPVQNPVERQQEIARPVELPRQEVVVREEVVNTPPVERVDPTVTNVTTTQPQVRVEQPAQRDETEREGADSSGDVRGVRGRVEVDQGTGIDPVRSAPYQLVWEGDIQRSALVQPMPNYTVEVEAVLTIRFEVRPDGRVGTIQPLRRMNPELEAEVIRTLRGWRFSPLPQNMPQTSQFGVITFRFVLS